MENMTDLEEKKAQDQFDSVAATFDLLMAAKQDKLETPTVIEVGFTFPEEKARESLGIIVENVEDEGYAVDTHHIEQTESVTGEERHRFSIRVHSPKVRSQ